MINMKIFISYRFSDIPKEELEKLLNPVCKLFKSHNIQVFCDFYKDDYYKENGYTVRAIMDDCFSMLDQVDLVLCLVDTPKTSCGMLLEIGYALAKEKLIMVCSRNGCEIDTLCKMADENITYNSYDELLDKIQEVFGL
jgi:nucleoside 2-deoxyribosyltransferase